MPRVKKLDLGMTALDELFMNDKERAENKLPKIFDIPLSEIDDFPGHPYRVLDDEDMQNLMESIKDRGVITPAMVRKKDDGRYEMISGHRRKHASERLGLETLRCEVVEVSRDGARLMTTGAPLCSRTFTFSVSSTICLASCGHTTKHCPHTIHSFPIIYA